MKNKKTYENPLFEVIILNVSDILTASLGTEGPSVDENDGSWDLSLEP